MKRNSFLLFVLLVSCGLLSGCAAKQESLVDNFRGTAFNLQKYNQIVAVDQQPSREAPTGMDGEAAVLTYKRYLEGFKEPEGPEYSLSLGSVRERR
ncbi:MAG: hypothetical protein OEV64_01755 [Desulfobulbaceae bacterium]|nr:hypothetical protein [Desulfobulbaceae bacterium]